MIEQLINSANRDSLWILPFGGFFGALGLVVGLWLRRKTKRFLQTAVETTGVYVKAVRKSSDLPDRRSTSYRVVEFKTADGETFYYRTMTGVPWAALSIGDSASVLYDPMRPEVARLNSWVELVLPWAIFLLVGGGILLTFGGLGLLFLLFG